MSSSYTLSDTPMAHLLRETKPRQKLAAVAKPILAGIASSVLFTVFTSASALAAPTILIAQNYPLLAEGSTGSSVSQLQATLKLLGFYPGEINGSYTAATQDAVAQFQSAAGISADGITGPSTWAKLLPAPSDVATIPASQVPIDPEPVTAQAPEDVSGPPILRPDIEGPAVSQLQRELTTLGYYQGAVDGKYEKFTQEAVRAFQSDRGLVVDAIVGPSTWDALTQALGS